MVQPNANEHGSRPGIGLAATGCLHDKAHFLNRPILDVLSLNGTFDTVCQISLSITLGITGAGVLLPTDNGISRDTREGS